VECYCCVLCSNYCVIIVCVLCSKCVATGAKRTCRGSCHRGLIDRWVVYERRGRAPHACAANCVHQVPWKWLIRLPTALVSWSCLPGFHYFRVHVSLPFALYQNCWRFTPACSSNEFVRVRAVPVRDKGCCCLRSHLGGFGLRLRFAPSASALSRHHSGAG
jgi:hypothetical protein